MISKKLFDISMMSRRSKITLSLRPGKNGIKSRYEIIRDVKVKDFVTAPSK